MDMKLVSGLNPNISCNVKHIIYIKITNQRWLVITMNNKFVSCNKNEQMEFFCVKIYNSFT